GGSGDPARERSQRWQHERVPDGASGVLAEHLDPGCCALYQDRFQLPGRQGQVTVTRWPLALLAVAAPVLAAESGPSEDGMAWLRKMATASRQLNYNGTFVYRHATQTETSRVVHYVNHAGGEFEKMETVDGPAREV